jgi:hypothetical protein
MSDNYNTNVTKVYKDESINSIDLIKPNKELLNFADIAGISKTGRLVA